MHSRFAAIVFFLALLPAAISQERLPTKKPKRVDAAAEARTALFLRSDLNTTLKSTEAGLRKRPRDPELLFLRMEAAALEADTATTLDAALRLCELHAQDIDPRGTIAASRILDLAGNTMQFRQVIPRVRRLITTGSPCSSYLRSSLIAAAAEGAPGLNLLALTRESGVIVDWRLAGPYGKFGNVDFEQAWPPERDSLIAAVCGDKHVERIRWNDGNFDLPNYFRRSGVYYAASTVRTGSGQRTLRVESGGTLEVFVDGQSVLRKDDRFRSGPDLVHADVKTSAGNHQVLVKFIPSALPFRLALLPRHNREEQKLTGDATEIAYISAARNFWSGNYADAATQLLTLRKLHRSAATDFMLANTWEHSADDSPEETNYLLSALKAAPSAAAVEFRLAEKAHAAGRTDQAWQHVSTILAANPELAPAQEMAAKIAIARDWTVEAIAATDALIRLHPTCNALEDAYKFYNGHAQFDRATGLLKRLETCSPDSTSYLELLSNAGEHQQAARAAAKLVLRDPLSRRARYLEVRELALAGKDNDAHEAALQLAKLAPNSRRYQKLASSPDDLLGLLDEATARGWDFLKANPFYSPYRRDAMTVIRKNADTNPSAPAVTLLEDKVSRLADDGSVSVYFHRIVKVLTRSGIESHGEVSLPANADLLELRTIKQDGTIAEPEFHENKVTISMPALSPGDAIEQEYVVHYADRKGTSGHAGEFTFTFGWYGAHLIDMRFVALTPIATQVSTQELNGAPKASVSIKGTERVQVWERHNILPSLEESALPAREILPTVKLFTPPTDGWKSIRDYFRDMLIDATRVGPRTQAAMSSLHLEDNDFERLKVLYTFVNSRIRADRSSFANANVTSAEDTLATNLGSRTFALIALAHAAGMQADLVLARDVSGNPPVMSESAFTRPLVQVNLHGTLITLDMESDSIGMGLISPTLDRREALLVPTEAAAVTKPLISLGSGQSEQSVAEGDLRITPQGDLDARVTIRLGAWRAAQMRSTLSGVEPGGQQQFLQQLAARIFSGATDTTGVIRNERELDRPLELTFRCRAPQFVNLSSSQVNADQFVPTLGLRQMYANPSARQYPLFVDTPLVERTTFRIELPPGVRIARRVNPVDLRTSFGRYRLLISDMNATSFEVTRDFEIPVQVIVPDRYADFRRFATQIDDAERQRFAFAVNNPLPASSAASE